MSEQDDTQSNTSFTFGEIREIAPLIHKYKPFQFYFVHKMKMMIFVLPVFKF